MLLVIVVVLFRRAGPAADVSVTDKYDASFEPPPNYEVQTTNRLLPESSKGYSYTHNDGQRL